MKRVRITFNDGTTKEFNDVSSYDYNKETKDLVLKRQTGDSMFSIMFEDKFANVDKIQEILHNKKI